MYLMEVKEGFDPIMTLPKGLPVPEERGPSFRTTSRIASKDNGHLSPQRVNFYTTTYAKYS